MLTLDHVALSVADRARSAAFYGAHFGFTQAIHEDAHLLILAAPEGSALLALAEAGAVPADMLPRTNHFGFRADDGNAVRAARAAFAAAGVTETEWQDDRGFVRCQVLDPDGYRVEIYATP